MIRHIFKIIWTERRVNFWILLELTIAFGILWFCAHFLIHMASRLIEPAGFDISHTYHIIIGNSESELPYEESESEEEEGDNEAAWTILDRIKSHSAIEYASLSLASAPYSGSYWGGECMVDTLSQSAQFKYITPEFFDVFKIKALSGRLFNEMDQPYENKVIISAGTDNLFGGRPPEQVSTITQGKDNPETSTVVGVAERTKHIEYEDYQTSLYRVLGRNDEHVSTDPYDWELSVRVKPEADKNFIAGFVDDMENLLEIPPYYLASVIPVTARREEYMEFGDTDEFNSVYALSAFLIINIFLCVIGTFWFRIQSRRSDIGLRMALGASRRSVLWLFLGEALFLLLLASIIAIIIDANIGYMLMGQNDGESVALRYLLNYGVTLLFLSIVVILSVWYPAKKAAGTQPVEALREE